jgi:hypothetical protein
MLGHGDCSMGDDKCSVGWLMSAKMWFLVIPKTIQKIVFFPLGSPFSWGTPFSWGIGARSKGPVDNPATSSGVIGLSWFSKMATIFEVPTEPKFGVNIEGAQIHVLAKLEHSMSNSNKISQLCNLAWSFTSATLKSRSNQKPGYHVMIRLDVPMIKIWRWSNH